MERPAKRRKGEKQAHNPDLIMVGGKLVDLGFSKVKKTAAIEKPSSAEQRQATNQQGDSAAVTDEAVTSKNDQKSGRAGDKGGKRPKKAAQTDSPLLNARRALPIWSHKDQITSTVRDNDVLLLVGETGSGKSTQVPQFLCHERWCQRKKVKVSGQTEPVNVGGVIAITQPRRVAATTLASRVAREMGTPLGSSGATREGSVGYSVRFDHNVPKGTKIKFLTEGMLLQELLRDPNLRQYSAVIVDEIHERSVDVDLISGFLKQIVSGDKAGRGGLPLKVVVMSATADVEKISDFFNPAAGNESQEKSSVQVLRIKGRQYPVNIKHTQSPVPDIREALFNQIKEIHEHEPLPGDVLAFLAGQEDIEALQKRLEEYGAGLASDIPKILACPLYGQLSVQAQQAAFQPAPTKLTRKIILATNIAETSVTVPGVRHVIDCGKAKVKQYRARLGLESLLAKPISKSSALQRAGRAGREGPGKCFRLYTAESYKTMKDADLPEILRNDVLGAVLTMKARGINDVFSFPLMDFPDVDAVEKALIHLHFLGAIADDGAITDIGRKIALFPVTAPYGRVLLAAAEPEFDCLLEAIDIISCITAGESIFHQLNMEEEQEDTEEARKALYRREGDILTYLTTMQQYTAEHADRVDWCKKRKVNVRNMRQALNIRNQLRSQCIKDRLLREKPEADPVPFVPMAPERAEALLKCFLKGFVTKCALLAPDGSYVTTQGKHVVAIHPASVLHGQKKEAIMFLEHVFTQKNYAKKVSAIQADWIIDALRGNR
ncbi:putative ATP-dependent RNA helicase prh1 [Seiridium cardinale]|uniref:RNA helicase n=1 Tax=Seiridium cardinale TaxID=138064 RepID=A0ABR2XIP8_9PEZI